jgi:hypothetical protein
LTLPVQQVVKVQTGKVEAQLEPKHLEEALDVIGGTAERDRCEGDTASPQLAERLRAAFVAWINAELVSRAVAEDSLP